MSTTASSAARPIPLRMRPDLQVREQRHAGQTWWVVKEPIGLTYARLRNEEYAVLRMLDGRSSLEEIKGRFEREFAPRRIATTELQAYLGTLHRGGLVTALGTGQGEELLRRADERRRRRRLARWTNVLSIRFRGVDPERFLTALSPLAGWIFSPAAALLSLLLCLSAVTLIAVEFDTFRSRLPAFHEFFQIQHAGWLLLALAGTKVLHELGHGLACKRFGGECHEMGLMLLVFTPCLYCNVTDAWMLPSKWQRAAIAAAGMYVELTLAAVATLLWWWSEPGTLNYFCLAVMFICSVSTLLLNGNPLMRYDGYFILSHLTETPNLAQQARGVLLAELSRRCLGLPLWQDRLLPSRRRGLLALYAAASTVYRCVVLFSILWFLERAFERYDLQVLGRLLVIAAAATIVGVPLWGLWRFFRVPGRLSQVKRGRLTIAAAIAGLLAAAAFVPLPCRVYAPLTIQPRDARRVYVTVPGILVETRVRPGDEVADGDVLAVLRNDDLEVELAELRGRHEEQRLHVQALERQRAGNPAVAAQIPAAAAALQDIQARLASRQEDHDRLTLRAPAAGTVLPPPRVPARREERGVLPGWHGTPLDEENRGAYLAGETQFCAIGDPARMEAVLVVDQRDVEWVREGQSVELRLEPLPDRILNGVVADVAEVDLTDAPAALASHRGGGLETRTDAGGGERPANTSYQARVPLDAADGALLPGYRGQAKIQVAPRSVAARLWRYLGGTFRFRW